jgi:CheY-like chemotaxis protein
MLRALLRDGDAAQLPEVVLLDLNLPGTDGRTILGELKSDERLKLIPVVVLSTSTNPRDVADCYAKGVNGYCTKGGGRVSFDATISSITRFWFQTALLPNPASRR